jgi:hypothetical protein
MTFSCPNHEFETDTCRKLKGDCIQGRPGCILEGKFKLSDYALKRIKEMEEGIAERKMMRKRQGRQG